MLLLTCSGILMFILVTTLTMSKKLQNTHAYLWILVSISITFLGIILPTKLIQEAAKAIGIKYPPTLFTFLGFLFLLVISLWQSIMLSKHESHITKLTQEVSLINQQLNSK